MKKRYLIGGIILAVVAGYLLSLSFDRSLSYYVTVSELLNEKVDLYETNIRVAGKVADLPVTWDAQERNLSFTIVESDQYLPVVYQGTQPDGFKADADIVVDGKYYPDNIFQASSMLLKCPSKYETDG
ncbi:cytochrome c maturation protein CcmE [Chloroflexota bacterium]